MMEILLEDKHLVVCVKPVGVDAQALPQLLQAQLGCEPLFCVHRLDQMVGGVIVLAKTAQAAAKLANALANGEKQYLAVLTGCPEAPAGVLQDLLYRDAAHNKSYVVRRKRAGVKAAELEYETLATVQDEKGVLTLVRVRLHTGRTHQIRVQFASRRLPLLGDGKYGGSDNRCSVALWARQLEFSHPANEKPVCVSCPPPTQFPWNLFTAEN